MSYKHIHFSLLHKQLPCTSMLVSILWLFQIGVFFLGVIYPMHYRLFTSTRKLKFLHATMVAIGFLLPVIPLIIADFDREVGYFKKGSV